MKNINFNFNGNLYMLAYEKIYLYKCVYSIYDCKLNPKFSFKNCNIITIIYFFIIYFNKRLSDLCKILA